VSILHVLRDGADAHALPVIQAQAEQGADVRVLLLAGPPPLGVAAPVFAVGGAAPAGAKAVSWREAVELLFAADTVVTW
jgi:hypothetical protein